MANTNGKKARKAGGGNRYAIKKSWKRSARPYRYGDKEREAEHRAWLASEAGRKYLRATE